MQWLTEYRDDVPRIERFNVHSRITHWGHTVTYLLCLFTGLALYLNSAGWLAIPFGGFRGAGLVHRISAVLMTLIIVYFVLFNFKVLIAWIKDILSFGKNDIGFLIKFPQELLGFKVDIPPQTKFNGGEKGNSIVTPTCVLLLVVSGYIMWFPAIFPVSWVRLAYPIHDLAMILSACMVAFHGYLGSFHPGSGESFWGMWKGTVREDWAEHHHNQWYNKVKGESQQ